MEMSKTPVQQDKSYPTLASLRADYVWWVLAAASIVLAWAIYQRALFFFWVSWMAKESLYSHGPLVPLISLFAIYTERKNLLSIPLRPNLAVGVPALLIVMLLAVMVWIGGSPSIYGLTFPLFLLAAVVILAGLQMARALAFPILFLLFMCPIPGALLDATNVRVQIWSTEVAVRILRLMRFDVCNEGTTILMPSIAVTVGLPCSGFRMLISMFAFSTFFALMKEGPWWGRVGTVVAALPLALAANSVRVTLIALVGEFYGEDVMHSFHDWSGYIMLVVAFVALEFISRLMRCRSFRSMQ